jgi:hypothetical protein
MITCPTVQTAGHVIWAKYLTMFPKVGIYKEIEIQSLVLLPGNEMLGEECAYG